MGSLLVLSRAKNKHIKKRNPELTPLPVSQTLTSCQMLPVTVTGSAFDRKIVSVLPVPFCQVLVSRARPLVKHVTMIWN